MMTAFPRIISESVTNAPMNKNAHILFKEAKIKRPEIVLSEVSPESNKSTKGLCSLFCASRPQEGASDAEENLSKLHSVSQLSEKILENCSSSPLANVPNLRLTFSVDRDSDDFNLVKPCVKLSRQVEYILLHNTKFTIICYVKALVTYI